MKPVRKPKLGMALGLAAMVLPAMALADGDGRIFVPLGSAGSALVLDSANGQTVGTISGLPAEIGRAHV